MSKKYIVVFGKRVRRLSFDKLTDKERFLLYTFNEDAIAALMFTGVETVRFWTEHCGMPYIKIRGPRGDSKFYHWLTVDKWLNTPITKGAKTTNIQKLFMITPDHLVPRYVSGRYGPKKEFKVFWLVPLTKKHLAFAEQLKRAEKQNG
jgi:hypothetical protein